MIGAGTAGCTRVRRDVELHRVARFVVVGCAAAAVHWLGVVLLVGRAGWAPLLANPPAWLVAFGVSFVGHHRLTFRDHQAPLVTSAWRFFTVSLAGFALNEALYAALLRWSDRRYALLLALLLVVQAAATYLLGRHWAFARSPAR